MRIKQAKIRVLYAEVKKTISKSEKKEDKMHIKSNKINELYATSAKTTKNYRNSGPKTPAGRKTPRRPQDAPPAPRRPTGRRGKASFFLHFMRILGKI